MWPFILIHAFADSVILPVSQSFIQLDESCSLCLTLVHRVIDSIHPSIHSLIPLILTLQMTQARRGSTGS